ncbi:MAG: C40 family peptidase [Bacteroidales bacterium]|nr:C40 family peptidase [Bacteroidales bacterium]
MKRIAFPLIVAATLLLSSCEAIRNFLSHDLEEEDFIIGKLYEDEYVAETPVISRPVQRQQAATAKPTTNPLGLDYSATDNQKLYDAINSWLGVPYKYGGTTRDGIDCSAFVGHIYKEVYGLTLNRTANDMQQDVRLIDRTQLREGDLLFFINSKGKVSHVGIYLKDSLFAHASTSNGVCLSRLTDTYWTTHFYRGGRHKKFAN